MGISAFAKRHPVVTYYGLMFAISWGFGLIVLGPDGFVGSKPISGVQLPLVYVAALAGPIVTGLLSVGLVRGRAGMRDLLSRLLTWRVSVRWYAVALLTAPLLTILTLLALSLVSANFLPAIMRSGDKMRPRRPRNETAHAVEERRAVQRAPGAREPPGRMLGVRAAHRQGPHRRQPRAGEGWGHQDPSCPA